MPKGIPKNGRNKGWTKTEGIKNKISESLKGRIPWNKNKTGVYSKEILERRGKGLRASWKRGDYRERDEIKNSERHKGEKNPNWKGGKSFEPYSTDWTEDLKESIRRRDNYTCQECGIHQDELNGFFKKLDVHHIDYDKDNLNPINLIALCRACHQKTNFNRRYWIEYYKTKVEIK